MPAPAALLVLWLSSMSQMELLVGSVLDASGAAITSASLVIRPATGAEVRVMTDATGRFTTPVPAGDFTVTVTAPGFRTITIARRSAETGPLEFRLVPGLDASVTVTAGRLEQQLTAVASAVSTLDRADLERSPALTTDETLRQVPAFSLFRRSSSIAAHPTAQGVSLRGIGPSGVSRTLVLLDGVPFNDPFGGWISWARVPRPSIERIEVVEGSAASLFGNYAMGGAINILTRTPAPWIDASAQ